MNILVTGSAGFIGSFTVRRLVSLGHKVIGIDNFDLFYSTKSKKFNIDLCHLYQGADPEFSTDQELIHVAEKLKSYDKLKKQKQTGIFEFMQADILDIKLIEDICKQHKIDTIINLAALSGVRHSVTEPLNYTKVNVLGNQNLLEICRLLNISNYIFASSSSIYGENDTFELDESMDTNKPISPYAATKRMDEILNYTYHHLFKINITNLRFFTVYGPLQKPVDMAIQKFIKLSYHNKPMTIFGDGSMQRDYTYIDDIVSGIINSLENMKGFQTYNLGNNKTVSLKDLSFIIKDLIGRGELEFLDCPPTEVKATNANIQRAKSEIGYAPEIDIHEGLRRQIEIFNLMPSWYRAMDSLDSN